MNTKPSNPPAFPHTMCVPNKLSSAMSGTDIPYDGMSLRDWFAGMAMQGLIAVQTTELACASAALEKERLGLGEFDGDKLVAKVAYDYADEMLTQREKD